MGHDGDGDVEVCFGSGNVSSELNVLNQQYMELVTWTMERLKIVKYVLAKVGIDVQVIIQIKFTDIVSCVVFCMLLFEFMYRYNNIMKHWIENNLRSIK